MENSPFKIVSTAIALIIIYSCSPYKKILNVGEGDIDKAIENVIVDYYSRHSKNKYSAYDIEDLSVDSTNFFLLRIVPKIRENKYILYSDYKIGSYQEYIPNKYLVHREKLFVWNDKNNTHNKEILNVLHKYNMLDSTYIKVDLGILDRESFQPPMIKMDRTVKVFYYIVCKRDISIFRDLESNKYPLPPKELSIICN